MRTLPAGPITPLLGSLGLHGSALLWLALAVRPPLEIARASPEHAEAWAGSALEVDAVATPDGVPTLPNALGAAAASAPSKAPALTARALAGEPQPASKLGPSPDAHPIANERAHRPAPRARHAGSAGTPTATDSSSDSDRPAAHAALGAFGSGDLPPGVRSLPSAFTRAIPPATGADPIWQALPAGEQRSFTIAVRVNADGHIEDSKFLGDHEGLALPEQFVHLRERVLALLGGGLFALQSTLTAGYGVFRITITLSDRAVRTEGEPAELVERGFDPPHGARPGRAYFTLASGRHFEAKVEVLNVPRSAHP